MDSEEENYFFMSAHQAQHFGMALLDACIKSYILSVSIDHQMKTLGVLLADSYPTPNLAINDDCGDLVEKFPPELFSK
ncbi:MAG: hypothetical protein V2I43_12095 [Parvularcula sp.]|nr:hypothetical protein [Parvularcula sp.]